MVVIVVYWFCLVSFELGFFCLVGFAGFLVVLGVCVFVLLFVFMCVCFVLWAFLNFFFQMRSPPKNKEVLEILPQLIGAWKG